jgi:uncharacterized membrane protein
VLLPTGKAFTVTVAVAVNGREQVPHYVSKKKPAVTAVTVTLTVPPAPIVAGMLQLYNLCVSAVPVIVKWHQHQNKSDY